VATRKTRNKGLGDQVLKAISHPIRIEVLRILNTRVASPNELSRELGESLSNVSYHFKDLRRDGCIELVDTQPRRGAVEHYYKAKVAPLHDDKSWAKLTKTTRSDITAVTLRGAFGEAVRALNAGTFDARKDRHLSWLPMEVDEQGWQELVERQTEWLEEVERIKTEAAQRLAEEGKSGQPVVAAMMGFEAPSGPGFTASRK
jgi:DNA-binding transcriptional ArsR family regulator